MKYFWARYPADPYHYPNWFVIGVRDDGSTVTVSRTGTLGWYALAYVKRHGIILGPEIPGPPEDSP